MSTVAPKVQTGNEAKITQARPTSSTVSSSHDSLLISRKIKDEASFIPATTQVSTLLPLLAQAAPRVSSPTDPAEREADTTAKAVMRMPAPQSLQVSSRTGGINRMAGTTKSSLAPRVSTRLSSSLLAPSPSLRSPAPVALAGISAPRQPAGQPTATIEVAEDIQAELGSGAPLPQDLRSFMEPRFRADFSAVRIHTNDKAARLSNRLSARAFTYGKHIFFGKGQYRPDTREGGGELIAHELTHTIQQQEVVQRQEEVTVSERSPTQVQRLGLGDALNYFANRANLIPGFRMFTIILGVNPINMSRVDRSASNILRALVEFLPGGALITQALDNHGVFDRAGAWVEQQIRTLGMAGSMIRDAINRFLDTLSWSDIFDLGGVWSRVQRIFTEPIDRIIALGRGLVNVIIQFVKDAILMPLARLASNTRGWDLLCAVLGRNPITREAVPRNADTLIGGFMKLIGQDEVWENIKRANAVARAWAWFQGALAGALGFVQQTPSLFIQVLRSLEIADIVLLPRAYVRVGTVFAGFAVQFFSWAGQQVINLLQIIFEVLAPGAMVYIRRAAGAFRTIIQDPIRFVGNLIRAGIQGLRQFAGNFLTHLRASLIGWLTGAMSGANIYIPQAFNLPEVLKFVLSVLGLTWQNIRAKLVLVIGETAMAALETGFDIVVTLIREGPVAAWQKIVEAVGNLRDMVMEQVMSFVRTNIVQAAITTLVSSLVPGAGFIRAIIAIYDTVMFFLERFRQITQVAMAFIDSIAAIASGAIGAAANRVEQTMAGMLTLVISFLARIVRLGNVAQALTNIINRVRQPIDRALDRVVEWIVAQARRLGRAVAQAGVPQDPNERLRLAAQTAVTAARRLTGRITQNLLNPILQGIRLRYGLREILPYEQGGNWWVRATINPTVSQNLGVASTSTGTTTEAEPTDLRGNEFITIIEPTLISRGSSAGQPIYTDRGYYDHREIVGGRWRIFYQDPALRSDPSFNQLKHTKRGTEGGSRVLANALAYKADGTTKNYQVAGAPPGIPIEKDNTMVSGKPESVYIRPLYWDTTYRAPGSSSPTGWARLKSSVIEPTVGTTSDSRWVRGHLINGQMGGPGTEWNLVPITGKVNKEMSDGHEALLRPLVKNNQWFWYRARVNYYNNSESADVANISDFPKQVIVAFLEIKRIGNTWQNFPSLMRYTYTIRKPNSDEIK